MHAFELPRRLLEGRIASALMLGLITFAYTAVLLEQRFLFLSRPFTVLLLALLGAAYASIATLGWSAVGRLPAHRIAIGYMLCIAAEVAILSITFLIVRDSGLRHSIILVPLTVQIAALPGRLRLVLGGLAIAWLIGMTAVVYTLAAAARDTTYLLANFLIVTLLTGLLLRFQETIAQAEYLFERVRESNLRIQASAETSQAEQKRYQALLNTAEMLLSARDLRGLLTDGLAALKDVIDYRFAQIYLRHERGYLYLAAPAAKRQSSGVETAALLTPYVDLLEADSPRALDDVRADDDLARAIAIVDLTLFGVAHFAQVQSWLGIPLIHQDRALGLLVLEHDTGAFYRDVDPLLLEITARQFAAAIDSHRHATRLNDLIIAAERRRLAELFEARLGTILSRMQAETLETLPGLIAGAQAELALQIDLLRPPPQGIDLALTAQRLISAASARSAIAFRLEIDSPGCSQTRHHAAIARILSGVIDALEKHSSAGEAIFTLTEQAGGIHLTIRERTQVKPGHENADRLSVPLIQREVSALGGKYDIRQTPDGWTECTIQT
jgi:GAF domain-containing protein